MKLLSFIKGHKIASVLVFIALIGSSTVAALQILKESTQDNKSVAKVEQSELKNNVASIEQNDTQTTEDQNPPVTSIAPVTEQPTESPTTDINSLSIDEIARRSATDACTRNAVVNLTFNYTGDQWKQFVIGKIMAEKAEPVTYHNSEGSTVCVWWESFKEITQ